VKYDYVQSLIAYIGLLCRYYLFTIFHLTHNFNMRKILIFVLALLFAANLEAVPFNAASPEVDPQWEEHFRNPPAEARPWVYWMWLRVDFTYEAITKDLEEMRAKGIEGAILYDTGNAILTRNKEKMVLEKKKYRSVPTDDFREGYSVPLPTPPIAPWEDRTLELYRFTAKEAGRLGIKHSQVHQSHPSVSHWTSRSGGAGRDWRRVMECETSLKDKCQSSRSPA
jgi:hypothetical protein